MGIPIVFTKGQSNTAKKVIVVMLKMSYYLTAMGSLLVLIIIVAVKLNFVNPIITGTTILIFVTILTYITEIKLRANRIMIRDPSRSLYT
jgi:uncharacterized membrane protein YqjE